MSRSVVVSLGWRTATVRWLDAREVSSKAVREMQKSCGGEGVIDWRSLGLCSSASTRVRPCGGKPLPLVRFGCIAAVGGIGGALRMPCVRMICCVCVYVCCFGCVTQDKLCCLPSLSDLCPSMCTSSADRGASSPLVVGVGQRWLPLASVRRRLVNHSLCLSKCRDLVLFSHSLPAHRHSPRVGPTLAGMMSTVAASAGLLALADKVHSAGQLNDCDCFGCCLR